MRTFFTLAICLFLGACTRPVPFTEYLVDQLLQENLASMTEPPLFEVKKIAIGKTEVADNVGSAEADIVLLFPHSLGEIAAAQQLPADSAIYQQYKNSFGEFAAGEIQRHHARYHFQRWGKKWKIVGSEPLAAPDITKP